MDRSGACPQRAEGNPAPPEEAWLVSYSEVPFRQEEDATAMSVSMGW